MKWFLDSLSIHLVLFKFSKWINCTTEQVNIPDFILKYEISSIDLCVWKEWVSLIHMPFSNWEMELATVGQHFFLPVSFLFLIFIIVMSFKQFTWNGGGTGIDICNPQFLLHKHSCSINKFAHENEMAYLSGFIQYGLGRDKWNWQIRLS